ncbi:helix-turn-helix transcriptional regulator [Mycolicibacterium mageritense]|uniref:helix-turn-helix transcriptional regulator n=1 Tax=Mycolicibacterium mageritense TaxID=53462 RepID=UPI0011D41842|nr:hypothetical protein [Mycolicibacterium mageritense]TXI53493.1 MAG: hypothetical protein E6Q55_34985 [Mycolicibacterium mageritense]
MTRSAPVPGSKPPVSRRPAGRPLPPCLANPQLWDSSDNADAIEACRHQCPRRVQCAKEALADLEGVDGVVAGVALPPQNEHGTSKRRRAAVKHLQTIADQQPQRGASRPAEPPAKPASSTYHPHLGTAQQPDTSGGEHHTACRTAEGGRPDKPRHPDHVTTAGAAELTGLSVGYLKQLRRERKGPKWWRTSDGVVHYWVGDVEKWTERWQRRHTVIRRQQRRGVERPATANSSAITRPSDSGADRRPDTETADHPRAIDDSVPVGLATPGAPVQVDVPADWPDRLQVDVDGAARMTGLTAWTLRCYRSTGDGPRYFTVPSGAVGGRRVMYWAADVQDWMERTGRGKRDPIHHPDEAPPIARAS